MKRCPSCNRTYADLSLNFCLEDGTPLVADAPAADPNVTLRYPPARDTSEPPPTELYNADSPIVNQVRAVPPPPSWTPAQPQQPKKSNAVWWILGGVLVVGIAGVGLIVVLVVLASIGAQMETSGTSNSNNRTLTSNSNLENSNSANVSNSNSSNTSTSTENSISDDFSEPKWGAGNYRFGDIWYADDEYHMRSKKETYLVMYAPSDAYQTEDATVKVTARSVDGTVPSAGFGLIVHGQQIRNKGLQDYALLIYPADEPYYEIITHRDGNQVALVPRTPSSVIRSGTNPNQLEVRINGSTLSFYINGQYLTRITDSANFRSGLAGFYTSDTVEVAFDDLEITRE